MGSIKEYIESEKQKDIMAQIIKYGFIDTDIEESDQLIELAFNRLKSLNDLRKTLKNDDSITDYGAEDKDVDNMIDCIIFFSLIIENAWLYKKLNL